MRTKRNQKIVSSIRTNLALGFAAIVVLIVGFGGWAMTAQLAGAVMAPGRVVVEGNLKRVQHREGGIVGEIHVRDGSLVEAGDLLIRLDDTITRATLGIVETQIRELTARKMRLSAERSSAAELTIPPEFSAAVDDRVISTLIEAERELFTARQDTLQGQKGQLRERISQIAQEVDGLSARQIAKREEIALIEQELQGVESLHEKGLVPFPKVAELRRMRAQLAGEEGQLTAEIARASMRVAETELQILQLEQDRLAEALTELRQIDGQLGELHERQIAAVDALNRIELRAPQAGIVHELAVHTIGGVIAPGDLVMSIVPIAEQLKIEARLQPADIDQVSTGQMAVLRFSAFNQQSTPELVGEVEVVSPGVSEDMASGEAWYTARISVAAEELTRLGDLKLVPGMPVDAFIQTGDRSAFSYLTKPLTDQMARAMLEN